MSKVAFVFPGQGSQSVGMISGLEEFPEVTASLMVANEVLGHDLLGMVNDGPSEQLNETQWTQPALLAVSVGIYRAIQARHAVQPALMAGHSLGEYSALVCAGALPFESAVQLVHNRGQYMQEAVPAGTGSMAAVLGMEPGDIEAICDRISGVVSPANDNAPGQIVIAGSKDAVAEASELCQEAGAKRVMPLAVSVPSHCELMRPAAEKLATDLTHIELQMPEIEVIHNVDVQSHDAEENIKAALVQQLYSPVRWTDTMEHLQQAGVETVAECGPGKVLAGLFKRFDRSLNVVPLLNAKGIHKILEG